MPEFVINEKKDRRREIQEASRFVESAVINNESVWCVDVPEVCLAINTCGLHT
jgi:hypothetical protein